LGVGEDDGEWLVQLVCQRTGQLAYRRHARRWASSLRCRPSSSSDACGR
jgi:hypothetical protein